MAQTSGFDPTTQVKTCFGCKMFDVANWIACLNGENGPRGTPSHEAFHLKEHWRFPQSLESLLPWTETISAHLEWWQNPTSVMKGADLYPKDHSIQLFTDTSNEGWGTHLGGFSGPSKVQGPGSKPNSVGCYGQLNSSSLQK